MSAAADPKYSPRSLPTFDGEQRRQDDYDYLVATALHKADLKKSVHPAPPGQDVHRIDLQDLTRSKRNFLSSLRLLR